MTEASTVEGSDRMVSEVAVGATDRSIRLMPAVKGIRSFQDLFDRRFWGSVLDHTCLNSTRPYAEKSQKESCLTAKTLGSENQDGKFQVLFVEPFSPSFAP